MTDTPTSLTRRERIALWLITLALDTVGAWRWKHEWKEISEDLRKELRHD